MKKVQIKNGKLNLFKEKINELNSLETNTVKGGAFTLTWILIDVTGPCQGSAIVKNSFAQDSFNLDFQYNSLQEDFLQNIHVRVN